MKSAIGTIIAVAGILLSIGIRNTAGASVVIDRVVAVVNNEIITLSDLQRESAQRRDEAKPDARLVLEDMIDRKLQMAAAKRSGMDVTDRELADAVADIMKRNSFTLGQFEGALAGEGLTLEQYKNELREQMTLSRMFNKFVRSAVAVDEAEVRSYYERNRKAFSLPEEIRVRQIYFALPENATPAQASSVKECAEAMFARAVKGEDFIRLIRENSQGAGDPDGDLGFMQREHMLPEIEEATRTLKPGEVAGPLHAAGGYHIIRLEEARTRVRPFDKVKDEIMSLLFQHKLENTYRTWLQTLRGDSNIENRL